MSRAFRIISTVNIYTIMYNKEVEVVKQRETGALSKKDVVSKWVKDVEEIAKKETKVLIFLLENGKI
jgi:hypothetical protein